MLEFGEIFPVLDDYAVVMPSALVVDDLEVVPFILSAPFAQYRAFLSAEYRPQALRF